MKKKILSLLLALVMVVSLIPTTVFAAGDDLGKVHVVVENTTWSKADGAPWEGTLVDKEVALKADSSMMSCIVDALGSYSQTGAENGYISEINGLSAAQGSGGSGWMGTLNDWFTNEGFKEFTVKGGKLSAGDEIRVMHTMKNMGEDLGGLYESTDKTVKALSFSAGELSPAFSEDTHSYTLTVPSDVTAVTVTPTATNKNFQVRTTVGGTEYKRTAQVPVADGTVITVKCGDLSWPSMSPNTAAAETYTVTVKQDRPIKVTVRSQAAGAYLHAPQEVEVAADTAEKYGFTDQVDGVSALDALVKAHELAFGDAFTADTAGDFLDVGSTGWISMLFGTETYACGFYVNQGYPNDGTPASYGGGYNGTMVTNTPLVNGDVVDFYVLSDEDTYSDYYTWVDAPAEMQVGKEVTVTVTGFNAMSGYFHKTPADLKAAAQPLEGAKLAWVNPKTGAQSVISGVVTDKSGKATFTVTNNFTGYLTAVSNDEDEVYVLMNPTAKVKEIPVVTLDLKGLHDAQLASLKLYTYTGGVKGDVDLLAGKDTEADGYALKYGNVKLAAGNYWVEGYGADGMCNGGIVVTVAADTTELTFKRAYEIYATNSGWVKDTDYSVDYQVVSPSGMNRKAEMGENNNYGTVRPSGIFVLNDSVKVTLTPVGDKAKDYNAVTVTVKTDNNVGARAKIPAAVPVTVTAPAGSTVSMGEFGSYYVYDFAESLSTKTEGDTVTVTFRLSETGKNHFLRVQHPDGVTYWTFGKYKAGDTFTVTKDDLHIGDKSFTKDTVYRFEKNKYDLGSVYLNINSQGYLNLEQGQTRELDVFRSWQAIENYMNAQIALPDVHYTVVDLSGQPSDVVTVTPDENNSSLAYMKANKAGTAIVLVTYDAMTHAQAYTTDNANRGLTAIWPECTGVFVVSVGADGSSIATNMTIDRMNASITKDEQKNLDAEHDVLYYLGDAGASYSFKPEDGCTVTVARSTVDSKMSFSGFTSQGVSVAEDGTVTVTGLTTGRHIVCVEKDGLKTYQVITAQGVSYDFLDADGNILPADTEFKAGDKVTLQFHGLISSKEKLAGFYNFNFSLYYKGANDKYFQSKPGGNFGVYDFSGNPERQKIEITIPEDWTGLSFDLTGAIKVGGFAGKPTHRAQSYGDGMGIQQGTNPAAMISQLPALSLKLEGWYVNDVMEKIDAIGDVTLRSEEAIQAARQAYDALSDARKAKVTNYDVLTAAEARLAQMKTTVAQVNAAQAATGDYLSQLGTPSVGSVGGEWMALGLARSGRTVPTGYYDAVVKYVKEHADENGRLDRNKSTDNSRLILALTAIGKDVTDVGGHNLLKGLDNMAFLQKQGINGPIWALIALDSHSYPTSGDVTREKLVQTILDAALEGGGWALSGETADVDMTAMALQALAPYYKPAAPVMLALAPQDLSADDSVNANVNAAVDAALKLLSDSQQTDGGFGSWGTANSESCAQVIVALTALGIDPVSDSRFVKDGKTVLDALCSFAVEDGGFKHTADGERNGMATEQGYYALVAYQRFATEQAALYDMSDVTIQANEPVTPTDPGTTEPAEPGATEPEEPAATETGKSGTEPTAPATGDSGVLLWAVTLPAAALAAALILSRKKREA